MIAYNINNGCYNCDIPCEQQELDSRRDLFECYKHCSSVKVQYGFKKEELNEKQRLNIIKMFQIISRENK